MSKCLVGILPVELSCGPSLNTPKGNSGYRQRGKAQAGSIIYCQKNFMVDQYYNWKSIKVNAFPIIFLPKKRENMLKCSTK